MKKLCSLLLSLTMVFGLAATFGISASAADVQNTFWRGFETNVKDYRDDRGAKSEWVEEGIGGSHGALKIQNGASEVSEPQYGGVTWEKIVNVPNDKKYNISMCIKPLDMEDTNFAGNRAMFVFYHYYKQDGGSEKSFHDIVYFSKVEQLTDGWLKLSYDGHTMSSGDAGNAQTPTGTYSGYSRIEFRAGRKTGTYLIDDLRVEPVPGNELVTGNDETQGPVYLVNDTNETSNTDIGGANGTAGCRLVKPTGQTADGVSFGNLKLKPGQAYKFSWWAKGTANETDASLSTIGLYLYGYVNSYFTLKDGAPTVTYNIILKNDTALTGDWQYYECIFKTPNQTVPEECYEQVVSFYPRLHSVAGSQMTGTLAEFAGKSGMEYYIDEIKLEQLESVYNGDFEDSLDTLVYGHERQPGYKPWITETGTTAVNASEADRNFARITQTGAATDGFSAYVAMDPSVTYKIKFDAKSDVAGAKLGASIYKAEGDTASSTQAELTSEWASYEVIVKNTDTLITSPKLTFTMTDGTTPLAGDFDIDNVSFEVLPEFESAISATSKEVGGVISGSAEFDGSADFGFQRVFISKDGKTWGQLAEGDTGAGASSSYTITEKDAGKYIRFLYTPGLTAGADYIYTPSLRTAVRKIAFAGTWGTDLTAEVNIVTDTFDTEEFVAIVALYNSDDEMIGVETYNVNELMNNTSGTYSIPCGDTTEAAYAKAYLWNNFVSIAPYCVSDTARPAE